MFLLSKSDEKELRKQYYSEPLFCEAAPLLKNAAVSLPLPHISVVYIWKTAREVCAELGAVPCPEIEIAEIFTNLKNDLNYAIEDNMAYEIYDQEKFATLGLLAACVHLMLTCKHDPDYEEARQTAIDYYRSASARRNTIPQEFQLHLPALIDYAETEAPAYDYTQPLEASQPKALPDEPDRIAVLEKRVDDLSAVVASLQERLDAVGPKRSFADQLTHRRQLLKQAFDRVDQFKDNNGRRFLDTKANWYFLLRLFAEQGLYESFVSYQPFLDDLKAIKAVPDNWLSKADLAQKKDYLTPDCRFPDWHVQAGKNESNLQRAILFATEVSVVLVP